MEYLPSYKDSLYLEHHGILGQKWGVRRYQNEDGSRTLEGKKREQGLNTSRTKDHSKLKTGLKIAAGVAVAGATAYALHKTGNDKKILETVNSILNQNKNKNVYSINTSDHIKNSVDKILKSQQSITSKPIKDAASKPKKLSDFKFERSARVDSSGKTSYIDLPKDKAGYADSFAKQMSNGKAGDYDYWYRYITNRMKYQ